MGAIGSLVARFVGTTVFAAFLTYAPVVQSTLTPAMRTIQIGVSAVQNIEDTVDQAHTITSEVREIETSLGVTDPIPEVPDPGTPVGGGGPTGNDLRTLLDAEAKREEENTEAGQEVADALAETPEPIVEGLADGSPIEATEPEEFLDEVSDDTEAEADTGEDDVDDGDDIEDDAADEDDDDVEDDSDDDVDAG